MRRALFATFLIAAVAHGAEAGMLTTAGSLAAQRQGATATLLPNGLVLIAGGTLAEQRIEVFDPLSGRSTLLDLATAKPLSGHTATRVGDGSVLIAGGGYTSDGRPFFGNYGSLDAEAFHATPSSLSAAGTLHAQRSLHRATLLADGRVLITGGENVNVGGFHYWRSVFDSAEIFDPATRTFRPVALPMKTRRSLHTATLLPNGRVLIAGGVEVGSDRLPTLEIFDPQTETFVNAGSMLAARARHTATVLPDGRVLIAGGNDDPNAPSAEIFDPATNTTHATTDVGLRERHSATLLRDGRVLIAGGARSIVVFDPVQEAIVERFEIEHSRHGHAAVLVEDGSVLMAGGISSNGEWTTEVLRYRPAPLKTRRRAVR